MPTSLPIICLPSSRSKNDKGAMDFWGMICSRGITAPVFSLNVTKSVFASESPSKPTLPLVQPIANLNYTKSVAQSRVVDRIDEHSKLGSTSLRQITRDLATAETNLVNNELHSDSWATKSYVVRPKGRCSVRRSMSFPEFPTISRNFYDEIEKTAKRKK